MNNTTIKVYSIDLQNASPLFCGCGDVYMDTKAECSCGYVGEPHNVEMVSMIVDIIIFQYICPRCYSECKLVSYTIPVDDVNDVIPF